MKTKFLFLFLISHFVYSQIWVNSLDDAKDVAKASGKFILIDFNASWCGPCKVMDREFFHNAKYKTTLDKFILVSIDVDRNTNLAQYYSIRTLPNIKLVDVNGGVIYESSGFDSAEDSNTEFAGFPESSGDLYEKLNLKNKKKPTDEELLNIATSYQILLQKSQNKARNQFLKHSNNFFDKCIKNTFNTNYKEISELGKLFNLALTASGDKVIKKLDVSKISNENKSYAYYILAKANYSNDNSDEAEKNILEIEKLNNEEWISAGKVLKAKYNQKKNKK